MILICVVVLHDPFCLLFCFVLFCFVFIFCFCFRFCFCFASVMNTKILKSNLLLCLNHFIKRRFSCPLFFHNGWATCIQHPCTLDCFPWFIKRMKTSYDCSCVVVCMCICMCMCMNKIVFILISRETRMMSGFLTLSLSCCALCSEFLHHHQLYHFENNIFLFTLRCSQWVSSLFRALRPRRRRII